MSTFGEKSRALLATGRAANLPTVWSNVLVAFGLSLLSNSGYSPESATNQTAALWILISTLLAASALYLGGCFLGDYLDIDFDKKNRPSRPLPQGILKERLIKHLSWILFFFALVLVSVSSGFLAKYQLYQHDPTRLWLEYYREDPAALFSVFQPDRLAPAFSLASCIIAYSLFHKKNRIAALTLMSLCRFLLLMLAFVVAQDSLIYPKWSGSYWPVIFFYDWLTPWMRIIALCVGLYTFGLASVAATESNEQPFSYRKLLFVGMLSLPIIAIVALKDQNSLFQHGYLIASTLVVYLAWIIYTFKALSTSKPAFVSRALAGFCLLDACFAATFSLPITLICLALFGLALLLQKITPAT